MKNFDFQTMNNIMETINSILKKSNSSSTNVHSMMIEHFKNLRECIIKDIKAERLVQDFDEKWDEVYKTDSGVDIKINKQQIVFSIVSWGVLPHMGSCRGLSIEKYVYHLSCKDGIVLEWEYSLDDDVMNETREWSARITKEGECIIEIEVL